MENNCGSHCERKWINAPIYFFNVQSHLYVLDNTNESRSNNRITSRFKNILKFSISMSCDSGHSDTWVIYHRFIIFNHISFQWACLVFKVLYWSFYLMNDVFSASDISYDRNFMPCLGLVYFMRFWSWQPLF